jgi:hypothetical protein
MSLILPQDLDHLAIGHDARGVEQAEYRPRGKMGERHFGLEKLRFHPLRRAGLENAGHIEAHGEAVAARGEYAVPAALHGRHAAAQRELDGDVRRERPAECRAGRPAPRPAQEKEHHSRGEREGDELAAHLATR